MKVVIIEDEKFTARDLVKTITDIEPGIEIMSVLPSVEEAVDYLRSNPDIDLIFSDIELGDGLSFEIFERLNTKIPVIFCTAYNQYALEAFKTVGIDYILKPFSKASVEKTLTKYRDLKEKLGRPAEDYSSVISILKNQLAYKSPSVLVYQGDKIIPVNGSDIALFWVDDDYTFALTFDRKKHVVSQKLESLEKLFSPAFFRANRQFLVNRKAVRDAAHYFNRKLIVNLTIPFEEQILVGKLKMTAFLDWLSSN